MIKMKYVSLRGGEADVAISRGMLGGLLRFARNDDMNKTSPRIILASRSPARKALLKEAGIRFSVVYPDVDERRLPNEPVKKYALRIALAKASKITRLRNDTIVIAVDTVIAHGKEIFGKPSDIKAAKRMLKKLSGKWHEVHSGTVIMNNGGEKVSKKLITTRVKFAKLSEEMIDAYIKTGEPLMAAGAYSIQNKGRVLIAAVDGCLSNVIGISVPHIVRELKKFKSI